MARRATILVVEAGEGRRQKLHDILDRGGYKVITASTVQGADKCRQRLNIRNIDLVISDVKVHPGSCEEEGYALFRRWTLEDPSIRFILFSDDPKNLKLPAVRFGIVPLLLWPFTAGDMLSAVRTALGGLTTIAPTLQSSLSQ
jgi:DNA-binding NtrC family response regulator